MKLWDIVKGAFAKADDAVQAVVATAERRVGLPSYSRHNPNPAWGDKRPSAGDRVVGRQVVSEGPRPFGETISGGEWAAGNFDQEYAAAPPASDDVGAHFFAARQALADRKR
jgi:hypothetical protein